MKKIFFLVLITLLTFPQFTSAQFLTGFGIKGGVTFSNQIYDYSINLELKTSLKPGFNASMFAEFLNYNNFNLLFETGYDQRGFIHYITRTDEFGNILGESKYKYRTNYIFTSLGAKLKYKSKYITPYLNLQPTLNFYLGYDAVYSNDTPVGLVNLGNPVLEEFKKIMFDLGFGLGVEFNRLLPFKTFIEANYFPGLINLYGTEYLKVKEYSFNFKLGINFIKDKKKNRK